MVFPKKQQTLRAALTLNQIRRPAQQLPSLITCQSSQCSSPGGQWRGRPLLSIPCTLPSALQPYSPRNPKTLVSRGPLAELFKATPADCQLASFRVRTTTVSDRLRASVLPGRGGRVNLGPRSPGDSVSAEAGNAAQAGRKKVSRQQVKL